MGGSATQARPGEAPRGPARATRNGSSNHIQLLRTAEVAARLQVSARTVLAWAQAGKLPSIVTPGGHRRYPVTGVAAVLETMNGSGDKVTASPDLAAEPAAVSHNGPA